MDELRPHLSAIRRKIVSIISRQVGSCSAKAARAGVCRYVAKGNVA
jgi:hypothetical protein